MELFGRVGRVLPDVRGRGRIAIAVSSLLMKGADLIVQGKMARGHRMRFDCRVPSQCWAFFRGRYDDSKIALLSAIANRSIEELHQEAREKAAMGGFSMSARTGDERQPGVDAHFEAATPATVGFTARGGRDARPARRIHPLKEAWRGSDFSVIARDNDHCEKLLSCIADRTGNLDFKS
jgi:hypothetical protein